MRRRGNQFIDTLPLVPTFSMRFGPLELRGVWHHEQWWWTWWLEDVMLPFDPWLGTAGEQH